MRDVKSIKKGNKMGIYKRSERIFEEAEIMYNIQVSITNRTTGIYVKTHVDFWIVRSSI